MVSLLIVKIAVGIGVILLGQIIARKVTPVTEKRTLPVTSCK